MSNIQKSKTSGILWSHNEKKHPKWLGTCIRACQSQGFIWWDVGWRIDFEHFSFPITGYIWSTAEKQATHEAAIESGSEIVSQPNKELANKVRKNLEALGVWINPHSPLLEYLRDERETLTLLKLAELERLPSPLGLEAFKFWDGRPIVRPPQSYCRIMLP